VSNDQPTTSGGSGNVTDIILIMIIINTITMIVVIIGDYCYHCCPIRILSNLCA
jgi:hypothetical protein